MKHCQLHVPMGQLDLPEGLAAQEADHLHQGLLERLGSRAQVLQELLVRGPARTDGDDALGLCEARTASHRGRSPAAHLVPSTMSVTALMQKNGVPCSWHAHPTAAPSISLHAASLAFICLRECTSRRAASCAMATARPSAGRAPRVLTSWTLHGGSHACHEPRRTSCRPHSSPGSCRTRRPRP